MLNYECTEKKLIEDKLIEDLKNIFYEVKKYKNYDEIICLCVGTDRITGDCFGPFVGSKLTDILQETNFSNINVYGTLENNLSYENISKKIQQIKYNDERKCIIVVDAALSKKENIGKIYVSNKSTVLGKGLNKNKIEIGDISIKAVVAKDYKIPQYNFKVLQNISLNGIMKLADIVSDGIYKVIKYS